MKAYKYNFWPLLIILLFSASCTQNPVGSGLKGISQIELKVSVDMQQPQGQRIDGRLEKPTVITKVVLNVTGSDMDPIQKELSKSGNDYVGEIEVPKGNNREFSVTAIDANDIIQYEGLTTADIQDDEELIYISLNPMYPDPVSLTISDYTASTVYLTWTRNTDSDFSYYRVQRNTTNSFDLNNKSLTLTDISSNSNTLYTDYSVSSNTTYYYAVWVVDTEGLGYRSNIEQVTTSQESGNEYSLYIDDGTYETFLYAPNEGDGLFVNLFTLEDPSYIKAVHLYLKDESAEEGNYQLAIYNTELTLLFLSNSLSTASGTNLVTWTIDWSTVESDGYVYDDFTVGFYYTKSNGWPQVGFDTSSNLGQSYYYESASDQFFSQQGNLAIQATVQTMSGNLLTLNAGNSRTRSLFSIKAQPCPGAKLIDNNVTKRQFRKVSAPIKMPIIVNN